MDKESNKSIAALMKATRKFHSLQQTEFAAILGVTQGTISKIESASMGPELILWFKFLKSFNIQDPYCFSYHALEFNQSSFSNLEKDGSVLAPTFNFSKDDYIFTVKAIRPLFDFVEKNHSKNFDIFLKENKISKELFYISNHPITIEIAHRFFSFLEENKITAKSVSLLDLNFDHALGRYMDSISSSEGQTEIFTILNQGSDSLMKYEYSGKKGEYYIDLKEDCSTHFKDLQESELIANYFLLYPYHLMKTAKQLKTVTPQISEVKTNSKWHVTYT